MEVIDKDYLLNLETVLELSTRKVADKALLGSKTSLKS